MTQKKAKPFLKWAGGKTQLLEEITSRIPYQKDELFTYIEPFVGSGAVFFWVLSHFNNLKKIIINDINTDLINTYKIIQSNVENLISTLKIFENEYHSLNKNQEKKKKYYYQKRKTFNQREENLITQAALFIFLNKTCFNGLYRVNKKNKFNVPIGSYKKPLICDENNLLAVNKALQKVIILNNDFEQTLKYTTKKSFFYLDPPYKPLSETSSFTAYTKEKFNDNEQIRLKKFCDTLNNRHYNWILSNADLKGKNAEDKFFDNLFKNYNIRRVLAKRSINSNSLKRGKLTELLITN